ncbi:ankyrin 2,3/unc44 [Cordyceps fumosorosea ARSEF 2679]|uniref:Ankyrin 2,3/unc44 n=1 Tax=Cordyceps fumosorosea (strain ARSEF 2679) TaxID=1081104 RepID=A0A168B3S0_CORFA|nr:ankyrin 2,3/unc44 [Cordyceps fumosorosea ARSEF 2679]OAA69580.1 ankyrin 2,3/unc44 [Cordyceps fumosorosea ARSEF 2679]
MGLDTLPTELRLQIVAHLPQVSHINALCQVDRAYYNLLINHLYTVDELTLQKDALRWALTNQNAGTLQRWHEAGLDINRMRRNNTRPLLDAMKAGSDWATWQILHLGANICITDNHGQTPLHLACAHDFQRPALVRYLLAQGANPSATTRAKETPLVMAIRCGNAEMVEALLGSGADHSAQDRMGCAALHEVIESGQLEIARLLLQHGANPSLPRPLTGETPLHTAILTGSLDMVKLLVDGGADLAAEYNDFTPLLLACQDGSVDLVRWMLQNGVDAQTNINKRGLTPLHAAAMGGSDEVVKTLLQHQTPRMLTVPDQYGDTPVTVASRYKHDSLARMMVQLVN